MTNFPEFPSVQSLSIDYGESQEQDFPATLPLFDDLHLGIARIFPKLVELNWLRFKRASLAVTLSSEKFQLPKCIRVWRFLDSGKSNSALSCQDVGMADWGDVHARNIDRGVDIDMELEVVNGGRLLRIRSWVNGICNRLQVLTLDPPSCWYYT
ncbi:hypothetical protein EYR41_006096 [Orbilia oligospora]|uniref:Uncharacterized protein n=1 Tax=Orbilia oligospora TaxID=2813651 RepID=A0A8H2HQA0_ORBOL|nr:hypothetical protein EYR41_006096 [Orbilia oligospora]